MNSWMDWRFPAWQSPRLLHYHDANHLDIPQRNRTAWNSLVADRTLLPTPFIQLYDSNGEYCGRYINNGGTVEHHVMYRMHEDLLTSLLCYSVFIKCVYLCLGGRWHFWVYCKGVGCGWYFRYCSLGLKCGDFSCSNTIPGGGWHFWISSKEVGCGWHIRCCSLELGSGSFSCSNKSGVCCFMHSCLGCTCTILVSYFL